MSLHDPGCIYCGYPVRICRCTEAEARAWMADRDAQEAAERAEYYASMRKPVKVVEDELRDMGHKSGSPYLLAWEIEAMQDA